VEPFQPSFTNPPQLWPAETAPSVRIVSVGGRAVSTDPKSMLKGGSADVAIQNDTNTPLNVILEAKNVPLDATVLVMLIPTMPYGSAPESFRTNISASFAGGDKSLSTWQATIPGDEQLCALQVRADWNN